MRGDVTKSILAAIGDEPAGVADLVSKTGCRASTIYQVILRNRAALQVDVVVVDKHCQIRVSRKVRLWESVRWCSGRP